MIHLQQFDVNDFQRLIAWINNEEELIQFAGPIFSFPLNREQLTSYLSDSKRKVYKIIVNDNIVIGHAELYFTDEDTAKLCRILIGDMNSRGKGFCRQIVKELLALAFEIPSISKAELNVYDWNTPAIKCYEECGFVRSEKQSTTTNVNGKSWNSINMILNRDRWNKFNEK